MLVFEVIPWRLQIQTFYFLLIENYPRWLALYDKGLDRKHCLTMHFWFWFVVVVDYDTLLELNAKAEEELRAREAEEDEQEVQ